MAAIQWYITHDGHRLGPFTPTALEHLVAAGLLRPTDLVWTEGLREWVEASLRFPALFPPAGQHRYWLSIAGQARGPFAADRIRVSLTARQVSLETLACPEGGTTWVPLNQLTEFRGVAQTVSGSSHCRLLSGSFGAEEAELYLAGKDGDALAKLISTLLELKKNYASNAALVESLERSIQVLRTRREATAVVQAPD